MAMGDGALLPGVARARWIRASAPALTRFLERPSLFNGAVIATLRQLSLGGRHHHNGFEAGAPKMGRRGVVQRGNHSSSSGSTQGGESKGRIRGDGAAGVSGTWDGPLDAAQISPFSGVLQARLVVGEAGPPPWEQRDMARGGSTGRRG